MQLTLNQFLILNLTIYSKYMLINATQYLNV